MRSFKEENALPSSRRGGLSLLLQGHSDNFGLTRMVTLRGDAFIFRSRSPARVEIQRKMFESIHIFLLCKGPKNENCQKNPRTSTFRDGL